MSSNSFWTSLWDSFLRSVFKICSHPEQALVRGPYPWFSLVNFLAYGLACHSHEAIRLLVNTYLDLNFLHPLFQVKSFSWKLLNSLFCSLSFFLGKISKLQFQSWEQGRWYASEWNPSLGAECRVVDSGLLSLPILTWNLHPWMS